MRGLPGHDHILFKEVVKRMENMEELWRSGNKDRVCVFEIHSEN